MELPLIVMRWISCTSMMVAFLKGRTCGIFGTFIPTELTGKPVSSCPVAAAVLALSAMPRSSLVAASSLAYLRAGIALQAPLRGWKPTAQSVHMVGDSHSVHPVGQASHLPLAVEPYCPVGQKVVQLLPLAADGSSRKGLDPPALQTEHALASLGATQAAHPVAHGSHEPVALGAKPAGQAPAHEPAPEGQAARHAPWWKMGRRLPALQLRHDDTPGPSHVAHDASHASQVPSDEAYVLSGHLSKHLPPMR